MASQPVTTAQPATLVDAAKGVLQGTLGIHSWDGRAAGTGITTGTIAVVTPEEVLVTDVMPVVNASARCTQRALLAVAANLGTST